MILYSISEWLDLKACLFFLVLAIILADLIENRIPSNFPRGPWAPPFIGNVFAKLDFEGRLKLAKEYGNVYSLRFGFERHVFVQGYEMVSKALITEADSFIDRPIMPIFQPFFQGRGVILSSGPMWKRQRKLMSLHVRHFVDSFKGLEVVTQQESAFLCKAFKKEKGPFDPARLIHYATGNTIMSLSFGHRFEYSDELYNNILKLDSEALDLSQSLWSQFYEMFPWLFSHLPGPQYTVHNNYAQLEKILKREIRMHIETWDPTKPRDFIDAYLAEIKKEDGNPESKISLASLLICIVDLLEAGVIGPKSSLLWVLLFVTNYREVQAKVRAEIDRVIGRSRQPTLEDRPKMPYTEAVIHEAMRLGMFVPFGLPKMASKDTKLGGYLIPKGTTIQTDFSSVLRDKDEWETPDTFNPEHFLDAEGNLRKRDAFIPFSLGKRSCLGQQFTQRELFLFTTSLLQCFTFVPDPGAELDLTGISGFIYLPKPFKLQALPR